MAELRGEAPVAFHGSLGAFPRTSHAPAIARSVRPRALPQTSSRICRRSATRDSFSASFSSLATRFAPIPHPTKPSHFARLGRVAKRTAAPRYSPPIANFLLANPRRCRRHSPTCAAPSATAIATCARRRYAWCAICFAMARLSRSSSISAWTCLLCALWTATPSTTGSAQKQSRLDPRARARAEANGLLDLLCVRALLFR